MNFKYSSMFFMIIILFTFSIKIGNGRVQFEKTWRTENGSELKIEVEPDTTSFKTNEVYSFTFMLTAVKFGEGAYKFHEVVLNIQFLNSYREITATDGYEHSIISIDTPRPIELELMIPSEDSLYLDPGETLSGELQYEIDFTEALLLENDLSWTTNWETFADGEISAPPDYLPLIFIGGFVSIFLAIICVSGIGFFYLRKSRKTRTDYQTPEIQLKTQKHKVKQYCPHCGQPIGTTSFCSSCGGSLK